MKYYLIALNQGETFDPNGDVSEDLQVLDLESEKSAKHALKAYKIEVCRQIAFNHY